MAEWQNDGRFIMVNLRSNSMNRLRLRMKNKNYNLVLKYYLLDAQLAISSCALYYA
jgi:hypothetical protein